ncbi:MAG: replicative DNA helicase [Bacteroidales bacterium]|jgi:replicative DNA helicase|nr:replicative DNA helicase [Bacteroidales bacterium]MDD2205638.1 replicative DNA helicase [Bacteroidales bacterium]MDD3152420.1 replicative DNA helicase [Bacteroidales bacterium]MDD3915141.1 replicative DNA helicase [Bacteroidales bacterium]MDD4634900.1 replicative DNA helicase [Bacteroidales bacterium]
MEKDITKNKKQATIVMPQRLANESEYGKLPPQAVDLEEAVLGAIMLEKDALTEVIEVLQPEMFYPDNHQRIFKAIKQLFADNKPIDILTVSNQLKTTGELDIVGGAYYISKLTNRVSSSANTEFHSRIIVEKFIQRKLIEVSSGIIKEAYEDSTDVLTLLDKSQNELFTLTESNFRRGTRNMSIIMKEAIDEIEKARSQESGLSGTPSGFYELDKITGGWQKSDLIILAARPGMGKTAFALNMLRNMAVTYEKPVAFFSLEMSAVQLVTRLISAETQIPADLLRKGQISKDQWLALTNQITDLSKAQIFIDDTAGLSVFELRAKCRKLKSQYDIQFVAVDYLQLMTSGGDKKDRNVNREQEISTISRGLKALAKELEIPILALSQLSREVEKRAGDKKPVLSDLRESGAIEQDADIVMFIYRPEYYKINEDAATHQSNEGVAELSIAKHRNGKTADIPLKFIAQYAKFTDVEKDFDSFNVSDGYDTKNFDTKEFPKTMTMQSKMNDNTFGSENNEEDPF